MNHETSMRFRPEKFSENTLLKIITELNTLLPKIFLDAKITPVEYHRVENTKSSVCVSVTGTSSKKYFVKICPDDSIVTEIFWREKAHKINIPTPRTIYADTSGKKIPYMFEVLEFIDGKDLKYVSSEFKYVFAKLIGHKLKKLHCIQVHGFGSVCTEGRWSCKTWREVLERPTQGTMQNTSLEIFTPGEREKLQECMRDKRLIIMHPKLLHGDLNAGNFIYSEKRGEILFLDPGHTIGGDPMMDLAYASAHHTDSSFFRGLKDGYETEVPLTNEENYRFEKLRILCLASAAVGLYIKKDKQHAVFRKSAKEMLRLL